MGARMMRWTLRKLSVAAGAGPVDRIARHRFRPEVAGIAWTGGFSGPASFYFKKKTVDNGPTFIRFLPPNSTMLHGAYQVFRIIGNPVQIRDEPVAVSGDDGCSSHCIV